MGGPRHPSTSLESSSPCPGGYQPFVMREIQLYSFWALDGDQASVRLNLEAWDPELGWVDPPPRRPGEVGRRPEGRPGPRTLSRDHTCFPLATDEAAGEPASKVGTGAGASRVPSAPGEQAVLPLREGDLLTECCTPSLLPCTPSLLPGTVLHRPAGGHSHRHNAC